jgi:hypothetical protein
MMGTDSVSSQLDALRQLLSGLPKCLHGYWWNSNDLAGFLECGGIDGVDAGLVQQALQHYTALKVEGLVDKRMYNNDTFYVFGIDPKSETPKSQKARRGIS